MDRWMVGWMDERMETQVHVNGFKLCSSVYCYDSWVSHSNAVVIANASSRNCFIIFGFFVFVGLFVCLFICLCFIDAKPICSAKYFISMCCFFLFQKISNRKMNIFLWEKNFTIQNIVIWIKIIRLWNDFYFEISNLCFEIFCFIFGLIIFKI